MCDKKGPTLTVIQTDDDKILGGYLSKSFDIKNKYDYIEDPEAFIYSIDREEVLRVMKP
jgi:hypothetical protein